MLSQVHSATVYHNVHCNYILRKLSFWDNSTEQRRAPALAGGVGALHCSGEEWEEQVPWARGSA